MFPFFRRKRSKWEVARDTVVEYVHEALEHVPVDKLEHLKENLGGAASHGGVQVSRGAVQALRLAGDALHGAASTASEVKEHLKEAATGAATVGVKAAAVGAKHAHDTKESLAHLAAEKGAAASAVLGKAQEKWAKTREHGSNVAEGARVTTQESAAHAVEASQEAGANAQQSLLASLGALSHLFATHKQEAVEMVEDKADEVQDKAQKKAKRKKAELAQTEREIEVYEPEVVVEDSSSKFLWFAIGLLAGAVLAILFAPTSGRRSRALVKDKVSQAGRKATELVQKTQDSAADDADDNTITDRVRTELGDNHATRELPHLNIDTVDGIVTLRGPMLEEAQIEALETVVRSVKGVKEVRSELLVEDAPEDEATFVG